MASHPLSSLDPLNMTGIQASVAPLSDYIRKGIDTLSEVAENVYYCVRYGMSLSENLTDRNIAKKIIIHDTGVTLTAAINQINSYKLSDTQITRWVGSLIEATAQLALKQDKKDLDPKALSQLIQHLAHKTDNQKLVQGLLDKLKERLTWELQQTPKQVTALEAFKELALIGAARGSLSPADKKILQNIVDSPLTQSPKIGTTIFHQMVIKTFDLENIQELTEDQETIDYGRSINDVLSGQNETPLEIAARTGNTGGLDLLIRMTRPWKTSGEKKRLMSIAEREIKDPIKKRNFTNTFIKLYNFYDRKGTLKVRGDFVQDMVKNFSEPLKNNAEFMLKVFQGFPQELRDDKKFMLRMLEDSSGELRNNREFIKGVLGSCSEGRRKDPEFIIGILRSCSEELRNNREFILEVIRTTANHDCYVSIITAIARDGKLINEMGFIGEAVAALGSVIEQK